MPGDDETMSDEAIWETLPVSLSCSKKLKGSISESILLDIGCFASRLCTLLLI